MTLSEQWPSFTVMAQRSIVAAIALLGGAVAVDAAPTQIALPGDAAFPESMTATKDGTLYVSNIVGGGVIRVPAGTDKAEVWIQPGAFDTRSTFGVLADEATGTLWVCSNDASGFGIAGPSTVTGSFLKGFDLKTGKGKVSVALPGTPAICNDIAIGADKAAYVTNSLSPNVLRLKPGATQFEVWATDPQFAPPPGAAGLDGIAFGSDGNLYINTFGPGGLYRIDVKGGKAGKVTKLETSSPLVNPDALRPLGRNTFLMIEGSGKLDHLTIKGDKVTVATLKDGFVQSTGVAQIGNTAWVSEGQLGVLFDPKHETKPNLPFHLYAVPFSGR